MKVELVLELVPDVKVGDLEEQMEVLPDFYLVKICIAAEDLLAKRGVFFAKECVPQR